MNEQEKVEAYLSSVRHDMRSQLMVVREGASIILDNLVGSNCDSCFSVLRPALKSTDELNKLIGELLTVAPFAKILAPIVSAKEEEIRKNEKSLQGKEEELKALRNELGRKDEEMRKVQEACLRREEDLKNLRKQLKEQEETLKSAAAQTAKKGEGGKDPLKRDLEMVTYELMGMLSHVVRTPLAVVKESISLVLDEIAGELNPRQKDLLWSGKRNVDSLVQSVEELSQESWDEIVRLARNHAASEGPSRKAPSTPKKKILIVEDQALISNMLKMRLEANHYDVITAVDGEAGLEKARRENPSLIILDIMLPKMNGYKVCQVLKSDAVTQVIPIILSSGRTPQEVRKIGKEVGADAFVSKPFEAEMLLSKIKELLARRETGKAP
jgi:CheY-like chemotaxis protein